MSQADVKPPLLPELRTLLAAADEALASGQLAAAEALFRAALQYDNAPLRAALALPRVAAARMDWMQVAEDWRTCLARFPVSAAPFWLCGLRDALIQSGDVAGAAGAEDALVARFPNALVSLALLAKQAAKREDWAAALSSYEKYHELEPRNDRLDIWLGRPQALLRLLQSEAAMTAFDQAVEKFPELFQPIAARMAAAAELGLDQQVAADGSTLLRRFSAEAVPAWYGTRIRSLFNQGKFEAADVELAALGARFPSSSLRAQLALAAAHQRSFGIDEIAAQLELDLVQFPNDRDLRAEQVRILLGHGKRAAAAAAAVSLRAETEDHHALIANWLVRLDNKEINVIAASAPGETASQQWTPQAAVAIANTLMRFWTQWSAELALDVLQAAERRWPGRLTLRCRHATALIQLQRREEAFALIASIPALCQTQDACELRAWAAAQQGRHVEAREIWRQISALYYIPAHHAPTPSLSLERSPTVQVDPDHVTLIMTIRNERFLLPDFFAHYRGLGIYRYIIVDNMSDDGSYEYCLAQPDILLYRTAEDFRRASSGMLWRKTLIERHVVNGWCVSVDADEHLVYPGSENVPLRALTHYLEAHAADGLAAFMLDMYPARLHDRNDPSASARDVYYDSDYRVFGNVRAPYRQPAGGVHARLFGAMEYLHKVPLFHTGRVAVLNSHETTPLRLADVSGVLLHKKLRALGEAMKVSNVRTIANNRGPDVMRRYQRYFDSLAELTGQDLRHGGVTTKFVDSWTPVAQGLMQAGPIYRSFAAGYG